MSRRQTIVFFSLITLLLVTSFTTGYLFRMYLAPKQGEHALLDQAYQILRDTGLKTLPAPPASEYGMIRGMLQAYDDPYTVFVEPTQNELDSNTLQGSFGGVGVQLAYDSAGHVLLYPFPVSPARDAGVQDGDQLLQIDDLKIELNASIDTVQSAIRGPVGQEVVLIVGHAPVYSPQLVRIRRAEIPLPSVTWHLDSSDPTIGVVKINIIAASTAKEIRTAVQDLGSKGATRYIIDLRNNPGGLLDAGVDIARLFLEHGDILSVQYRDKPVTTYKVDQPGELASLPMALLVNENSASAAEIIAGALQAQGRAPLVGNHTYGKDSIQLVFTLADNSSLHVTAAKWWIPNLPYDLSLNGLQPDVEVLPGENTASQDPIIQAAARLLNQKKPQG
jgi:carboxyl-terminal processing protease